MVEDFGVGRFDQVLENKEHQIMLNVFSCIKRKSVEQNVRFVATGISIVPVFENQKTAEQGPLETQSRKWEGERYKVSDLNRHEIKLKVNEFYLNSALEMNCQC
jgi:hypothetical protein